jgi:hypothetical protein
METKAITSIISSLCEHFGVKMPIMQKNLSAYASRLSSYDPEIAEEAYAQMVRDNTQKPRNLNEAMNIFSEFYRITKNKKAANKPPHQIISVSNRVYIPKRSPVRERWHKGGNEYRLFLDLRLREEFRGFLTLAIFETNKQEFHRIIEKHRTEYYTTNEFNSDGVYEKVAHIHHDAVIDEVRAIVRRYYEQNSGNI